MYYLNKIIGAFLNPLGIGLLLVLLAIVLARLKRSRLSCMCGLLSVAWLWFWSTGVVGRCIGLPLELAYPPQRAEEMPQADAIVVLGGGTWAATNVYPYAEVYVGGDRVLHAQRLYKAGKAPKVFVTCESDAMLLAELGVPRTAITVNNKARNTEEEASGFRFQVSSFRGKVSGFKSQVSITEPETCDLKPEPIRPKILLVTSAWHMRRAKLMYERYATGVEVIPAATDYETLVSTARPLAFKDFVPDPGALGYNSYLTKEWIAYWGYRFLRK